MRGKYLIFFGVTAIILSIVFGVINSQKFEEKYGCYWDYSRKSTTLVSKAEYIDKYVSALESSKMRGKYNSLFTKRIQDNFELNLSTLKTYQKRLNDIKDLNPKTPEYQLAMSQITENEAKYQIPNYMYDIWLRYNHILLWNWICFVQVMISIFLIIIGFIMEDRY